MSRALIIIDIQNDYFPGGRYPQWNAETMLEKTLSTINKAGELKIPVILIQHIAQKPAPFFVEGSVGVSLNKVLLESAPDAPVVIKKHADSFLNTNLQKLLSEREINELLLCGMMTQNCVTHTALSKSAENYTITVLSDCCSSVDEMVHAIAINALADRVSVVSVDDVFG